MKLKDETGIALPLVIVVVLVATIIGATLFMLSTTETRQVARDVDKMKAHYIARSGAHAVAGHFMENPEDAIDLVGLESDDYPFAGGYYSIKVIDKSDYDKGEILHEIISTGRYNGVVQRISVEVKNKGVSAALWANNFDISGGAGDITGADVIFGSLEGKDHPDYDSGIEAMIQEPYTLRFAEHTFDRVVLPCEDETLGFFSECDTWSSEGDWTSRDGVLTVEEDIRYNTIEIGPGDYLQINAIDDNVLLKADSIEMSSAPIIAKVANNNIVAIVVNTINPSGRNNFSHDDHPDFDFRNESPGIIGKSTDEEGGFLLIYVLEEYKNHGGGNTDIFLDDNVHLNVYVYEDASIDIGGTQNFHGAIYAPDAKSVIFGTGHIEGWVIADEFKVSGSGRGGITFKDIKMADVDMNFDFYDIVKWLK